MRSDRSKPRVPSEKVHIHPGDKMDARIRQPLEAAVIRREKVDAGFRRRGGGRGRDREVRAKLQWTRRSLIPHGLLERQSESEWRIARRPRRGHLPYCLLEMLGAVPPSHLLL